MTDAALLLDILLVIGAAFIGGVLAHALRVPTILGFLAAGVAIGPATPGPVGDIEDVARAADIGVIFLMFGIGIQMSFRQLRENLRMILLGGGGQIALTILLGLVAGRALGFGLAESLVIGFLAANTSTVVAIKVLEGRQELASLHGMTAVNVSILQDLTAVVMVIVVPALGGEDFRLQPIVLALLRGTLLIAVAYVLATYVLPLLWSRVARARSRELSLLAAVTLALGLAAGSGQLGLSVAFGAFLAGLTLSENEYGYSSLSDVIPLRELFASIFFVAMGMLITPAMALEEWTAVLVITALIVAGKGMASALALRLAGLAPVTAIMAGLVLAQVGEFSFVIARAALDEGVIGDDLGSAFLAAAVVTILLNPALLAAAGPALERARALPLLQRALEQSPVLAGVSESELAQMRRHVIICGYGGAASALVRSLAGRNLPFVVIENNPFIYDRVRRANAPFPFIYGDASRPEVLEMARIREARVLAITYPGPAETLTTIANARAANPEIDILSRGTVESYVMIRRAGASEVVDPEFEASLEFVRHVLHRFGVDARAITALQARWRSEHYSI